MNRTHELLTIISHGLAGVEPSQIQRTQIYKEVTKYLEARAMLTAPPPEGMPQQSHETQLLQHYSGQSLMKIRRDIATLYANTPEITINGKPLPNDVRRFLEEHMFFIACHRAYQQAVCVGLGIEQVIVDPATHELQFKSVPLRSLLAITPNKYEWVAKGDSTYKTDAQWRGYGVQFEGMKPFFHRQHHILAGVDSVDTQIVNQEFKYIWLALELEFSKVRSGQINLVSYPKQSEVCLEYAIGGMRIETPEGGNSPQILQTKPKTEAIRLLEEQLREMEVAALPFRENALSRYSEGAKSGRAIEEERRAYDVWNAQCARWCADADIEMLRYILALNQHFQWFTPIEADADIQIEYPAFQTEYDKREAQRLEEEREQKQRAYELELKRLELDLKRLELDQVQKDRQHELAVVESGAERLRFLADLVQNNLLPVGLLLRELYGPDVDVEATMSLQKNTKDSLDSISAPDPLI